jgi:hypothetical protein
MDGRFAFSVRKAGGWSCPQPISGNIRTNYSGHPFILSNGRTLLFTDWGGYGTWDIWSSEWIDSLQQWGNVRNLGPNINDEVDQWFGYQPDDSTLIYGNGGYITILRISRFDQLNKQWLPSKTFDEDGTISRGWAVDGLTMPKNQKKAYVGRRTMVNGYFEFELEVSYSDSLTGKWQMPGRLNINSHPPDTVSIYNPLDYAYEGWPAITANGKTLYFMSNRLPDSVGSYFRAIYESHLLVDENGDSVISNIDVPLIEQKQGVSKSQNYPNPFNPVTTIPFEMEQRGWVRITLYDSIGREVIILADTMYEVGKYQLNANLNGLSSGIYYCRMQIGNKSQVLKMTLLR